MEAPHPTRFAGLLGALLALLLAACTGSGTADEAIEAEQLVAIDGVEDLVERFNNDGGSPRLILLVSPT